MTYCTGRIKFPDDGDHIRALGCIALCSANLEDAIMRISDGLRHTFPNLPFPKNLQSFRLVPNARALRKVINRQFDIASEYFYKRDDHIIINNILITIEKVGGQRNQAMHSRILQNRNGQITREIERRNIQPLTSAELYGLAEHLSILEDEADTLWFAVCRLRDYTPDAEHDLP
jgi:hypothetical protein